VIRVRLFSARGRHVFEFRHEATHWQRLVWVVETSDLGGRSRWIVQSIVNNNVDPPTPTDSERSNAVWSLHDELISIGLRGPIDPEQLARFEKVAGEQLAIG
jgi:hypothetical protein